MKRSWTATVLVTTLLMVLISTCYCKSKDGLSSNIFNNEVLSKLGSINFANLPRNGRCVYETRKKCKSVCLFGKCRKVCWESPVKDCFSMISMKKEKHKEPRLEK
eukprot:TCONS_00020662-protein